jgi:isopentenyl diphosphate isomerase/L-lactate dehydrogenase-like FMN-dependent dehydrogenase
MRRIDSKIQSVEDAEDFARRRLPRSLAQGIAMGNPTATFDANLAAFREVSFRPRVAVSYRERDLRTTVLGHELALPVLLAPAGNLRLNHIDGELGVARAAGAAGTIQCVSTFTGYPIEEIVAASAGPIFFQLYYAGGRANAERMIDRARQAGCAALIVTVDSAAPPQAMWSVRQRTFRPATMGLRSAIRFCPQVVTKPRWLFDFVRDGMSITTPMVTDDDGQPMTMGKALATIRAEIPVWEDFKWINELWHGPVIIKGVLTPEDARRAIDVGASAVVVSNHGGHLLDGAPASLRALPGVIDAVGDEVDVLLDSGIRSGGDVVRALALGANAVLAGRGYVWAHAAAGEQGVRRILEVFRMGLDQTLALIGCPSVAALDRSYVDAPLG